MKLDLKSGYYWVLLRAHLNEHDIMEEWDILWYNSEDDEWTECGTERRVNPHFITDVDPRKLIHEN